ncbi:MAG: zinc-ribbon domain-containing protein [Polyangiaceae bacterium]
MYVSCERCGTEYEFDDALVSNRGTSVKCTQCGHEFRVFRGAQHDAPERWRIRVQDGTVYEYREIRELQRAIASGLITPNDVLLRDGVAPRSMGMIPELESFFAQAGFSARTVPPVASITPTPTAPPAMPTPLGIDQRPPVVQRRAPGTIPYGVAVPAGLAPIQRSSSIPPPASIPPAGRVPSGVEPLNASLQEVHETEEPTHRKPVTVPPTASDSSGEIEAAPRATSSPQRGANAANIPETTLTPTPSLSVYGTEESSDRYSELPRLSQVSLPPEPYSVSSHRGSRGGLRWVVAIVGVGAIAVVGTAVWKTTTTNAKTAASERQDARVYGSLSPESKRSQMGSSTKPARS